MDQNRVAQDIQFIKSMIQQTQQVVAGAWMFFLVWGILVIVAIGVQFGLVYFSLFNFIWLDWVLFAISGIAFSLLYSKKLKQRKKVKTYLDDVVGVVILASAMGFLLSGFVFPVLGLYSWAVIPVLIAMVAGFLTFIFGGIYAWPLLKWCGIIWWLGAVLMCFVAAHFRSLIFIPLIIIGYIWPALNLRAKYYQQQEAEHAH